MVDENNINKIKTITTLIIILIIIVITAIIGINQYIKNNEKIKNKKIINNILNDGFLKNNNGTYSKISNKSNKTVEYIFNKDQFSIAKNKEKSILDSKEIITLTYKKSANTIDATYTYNGKDKKNQIGSLMQSGNYNLDNKKFECKVLLNKNFDLKCNIIKKEIKTFEKEINKWLK